MCFEVKKKYTYLSMCSCCNVVSKYSSTIQKHLQQKHQRVTFKGSKSLVIPIRIENKFEKKIKRTLDRVSSQQKLIKKQENPCDESRKSPLLPEDKSETVEVESDKEKQKSSTVRKTVRCSICGDEFRDNFRYLYHIGSSHSNLNVKVSFKCPYCNCTFQYLKDIQKHFEKDHDETNSLMSYLDCINVDINSVELSPVQRQCPYCELPFLEFKQLNDHVRESHCDHIEAITIKRENDENVDMSEVPEATILLLYNCRSCPKSFHTVQDLVEHAQAEHGEIIASSKPARKRKPPKWLENDIEDTNVKKTKTEKSSRNAQKMVVAVEKMTNHSQTGKKGACEFCNYIAKSGSAMTKHIKSKHTDSKQNLNQCSRKKKRKDIKSNYETRVDDEKVKVTTPKSSHSVVEGQSRVDKGRGNVESENLDVEKETSNGMEDTALDFDENDNTNFGDSDDDYQPENSDDYQSENNGSDSEESLKELPPFSCINCNNSFTSKKSLSAHIRKKHNSEVKNVKRNKKKAKPAKKTSKVTAKEPKDGDKFVARYKCPFCEFYIHHYEYIRSHVRQSHPEVTNFRINMKEMVSVCEEDWESFKCPNPGCDDIYKKKQALVDHMAVCAKGKLKRENIMCTLPTSWMENLEKSVCLICPYCNSVTQGKEKFENHLKEHYPGKMFKVQLNNTLPTLPIKKDKLAELECAMCPYCEIVTTQKIQLSKHFKRCHSNEMGSDHGDVIICILTNQSSVKEKATLIIRDIEQTNPSELEAQYEIEKSVTGTNINDEGTTKTDTEQSAISEHELKMQSEKAGLVNTENSYKDSETAETYPVQNSSDEVPLTQTEQDSNQEISKEIQQTETVYIQSAIPVGTYICPLCDNFQTRIKREIKLHMNEHNSKADEDVDSIYTIPDSWIKMDEENSKSFKCQLCDHEDVNLTLAFRHVLDSHKDITVNEPDLDTDNSGPLFEVVNVQIEGVKEKYEKVKYRCSTCVPGHIFKTKKGLQLHIKTRHTDSETPAVYDAMYRMLDLISDTCDTRQIYMCCICNEGLSTKLDLIDHFNTSHPERCEEMMNKLNGLSSTESCNTQPNCEVCSMQFTDERSLKHHLILHMNKHKPTCYLCDLCFTNNAELECHNMEVHSKSGEMCYKCGAMFSNTMELNRHIKSHDTSESSSIKTLCQYCGTSLLGKNMRKHIVDKHIELISCNCNICTTQEVPEWKKCVPCDQCDAVFCTWYVLRKHKYDEHNPAKGVVYKCSSCNETFSNKRLQSLHSHKCKKLFAHSQMVDDFNDHKILVNGGGIMEVTVLEEADVDFKLGLAHVKREYISVNKDAEKTLICKLCGKAFTKMKYICNHLKRIHTRDENKRYRCKVCKMGFIGQKEFKHHCQTTHIGLRQHQCNICQKRYKTSAHLKEHRETHTSQTYTCGYCGLEFRQRGGLLAHVVHHDKLKPLKCCYCEKGFTTHGDLQRHMNSYSKKSKLSGAKKLTFCNYCSKDFPNHNALVKHFQIHIPVNPFKCSVCNKTFLTFRHMYTHKSKKLHFTDVERDEGRKDLQAPGNRFRKYQVSKSKTEIKMSRKGKTNKGVGIPESTLSTFNDDQNVIEIEIDGSVAGNNERAKAVIEEFESDVIRSMLDADPEILDSFNFQDMDSSVRNEKQTQNYNNKSIIHDGVQFEIQASTNYATDTLTMQDVYESARQNAYTDINPHSQTKATADNSDKLADNIQQTFQAPDGSVIHVCVIKPDK